MLVVSADTAAPHAGAAFAATLHSLAASGSTAVLLQSRAQSASSSAEGPVVAATYVNEGTTARVTSLVPSLGGSSSSAPTPAESDHAATVPLCFLLKAADVEALLTADLSQYAVASSTPGEESIVPVEAAVAYLVQRSRVEGHVLDHSFPVGAADGRPHGVPDAAAAKAASPFALQTSPLFSAAHETIHAAAYARVGVMGNPSDGFGGKTLSVTIENFRAEAFLTPSSTKSITLVPHPIYDPLTFPSLAQLSTVAGREGYSGGIRLMSASLHRFYLHCKKRGITLPDKGFAVRYHTTVPRQVGLAGSSAIITAFLRAVLRFYGYGTEEAAASIGLSRDLFPSFVLAIETEELGITAGLQDRVVQSYEGAVHMNFDPALIKSQGYGEYTQIPVAALPPLFLAYAADPSDSGRIHAPIKQRWLAGDPEVVDGMNRIASLADAAHTVASTRSYGAATSVAEKEAIVNEWGRLMSDNFNNRRKLFGECSTRDDGDVHDDLMVNCIPLTCSHSLSALSVLPFFLRRRPRARQGQHPHDRDREGMRRSWKVPW